MFVRATYDREKKTVHYFDEEGNETLYIGGSFAWRTNNPGNLTKPSSYVMKSAIGYALRTSKSKVSFIIFPDRAVGQQAHQDLLKGVYGDKTIRGMITEYAPPSENDTESYINFVTKKADASSSNVVGSLSDDKFKAVSAAMEQKEGWVPGVIKPLGKPVQVQMFDKLNQPFAGQTMQLSGEHATIDARTNANGELPWIYSGLMGENVNIQYKRGQDDKEHVGQLTTSETASAYTFNAPYYRVPTRPRLHDSEERPRPRVHIVQSGETLSAIAAKYGTTVGAMVAANGLKDANHIYARQHLSIPATSDMSSAQGEHGDVTPQQAASATVTKPTLEPAAEASAMEKLQSTTSSPANATANPAQPHAGSASPSNSGSSSVAAGVVHQHAPSGHPQTVVSSPALEASDAAWCHRYPGSASLDSLNASFKAAASAFIGAMRDANITVKINAALRPIQRSYLMYHAFQIAKGKESPDKVPSYAGVNIDWVHRKADGSMDLDASIKAAKEMCMGYGTNIHSAKQAVGRPGHSRHNFGAAVDLNIIGHTGKKMKDSSGHDVEIKSFDDLKAVGAGYGVRYFEKENMHWSDNGS
ncbi:LysM peptidoglycan-binding domain-containing protein [Paraburkholderia dinghuensis]|uniref:LysM peptidoglycan-binding domain-containing protein n=1 Tax=Paraburkholderia dinghuensis TaxID=2305225 RepID=A0A3N6MFH6_9BURK|nr:LysM peptidoglycan-binding domain-containing protein [Paraburkholderia dinghuensis]RQH01678.1 LysM peptidoglycan-binding domain-containing protein [Paraburkholderia dinghuensis]